jgi:hypothetical protein
VEEQNFAVDHINVISLPVDVRRAIHVPDQQQVRLMKPLPTTGIITMSSLQ